MNSSAVPAAERLIVALDFDTADEARSLVSALGESVIFYKVGWRLFIGAGMEYVAELVDSGKKVFLDLKMNDIEETIRSALANLCRIGVVDAGVEFLTILGDGQTARAAREGRGARIRPRLLVLTALSSQNDADMQGLYPGTGVDREGIASWKARKALEAGCEGLIASGDSVRRLRREFDAEFGPFLIVTPGVRPAGAAHDDHKNVLTPYRAIRDGADYIVMGRPIRDAVDPAATAVQAIADIERALADA